MHALSLAATHRSSGKTTLAVGLCAALARQGLAVQPFKKGPDYIDPMWLSAASGRTCRNLDYATQTPEEIRTAFARHLAGADLGLVEGNTGLFDGTDPEGADSNAALAHLLGVPVVLVVDTRGMTRGIAPLLLGYRHFDPDLPLAGVILNRVAGSRHEAKLRQAVETYTDLPVLGAVGADPGLTITERHLGLVPANEAAEAERGVQRLGEAVAAQVDLAALRARAAPPAVTPTAPEAGTAAAGPDVRIGVARDAAFGFYYPEDLEAFAAAGAELVPFDTLHDARLPEVDGLFLGGGFPETQMGALAANGSLRAEIRAACAAGLPVYAECGGLVYLTRSLTWQGETAPMVGALPADAVMAERPQGKGYVRLRDRGRAPWSPPAPDDGVIRAHEFHHSRLENLDPGAELAFEVLRGTGIDGRGDGLVQDNVLACYSHRRSVARDPWVSAFVGFVRSRGRSRGVEVPARNALRAPV